MTKMKNQKEAVFVLRETEQRRRVSVNLTNVQKQELKALSGALGISLNILLSLLIRYFIHGVRSGELILEELLQEHQNLQRDRNGKKTGKVTLRIKESEYRELNDLANQWFYLPGELAGILAELFEAGIIDIHRIWNVRPMRRTESRNIQEAYGRQK
jgi:hypothetical protein